MPDPTIDFQSLPEEYRQVIRLAEETYQINLTPLQLLVGGWSGAVVYLVSISSHDTQRVEHCILKLDHKGKSARVGEVDRHNTVINESPADFARQHLPELAYEQVEHEGSVAIFYRIAGQSLVKYRPLSGYAQQSQLKTIFTVTNQVLLDEWNANAVFEQSIHPQKVLEKWLGFRLQAGGNIERFLHEACGVNPDVTGLLVSGEVYPNPLAYARQPDLWGKSRSIDIASGFIHGDLNTNNILVKFGEDNQELEGYYLIDFALFKEQMPLLYDQRYLEMSYLEHAMARASLSVCIELLTRMAPVDILEPQQAPVEMAGASAVIASARKAFADWVQKNHPSLHDDLWGQYWLAGVAAGLSYCHKAGQADEQRLLGLIYAAANLKRYGAIFNLPQPHQVELLYDSQQVRAGKGSVRPATKAADRLPIPPTPFVGRSTQIAAIKEMLLRPEVRLITLIGPGGTGKTRLSLQVAQEMLDQFTGGAVFVPLEDDTNAGQFVSRLALQLDVREGGRPLLENVEDYLREKCLLLVLDNFEQLVSVAAVISELLAEASLVKIIVSSRIPLNVSGEHEFPVPPLELPKAQIGVSAANLAENEAVLLFVQRAQAVRPDFALTDENALQVAEICRRLDGLPLALELAAARLKILPPQAILERLVDRFKLLTGGGRDLPARQQTLRNTLEWSYSLLSQDEKTLYSRLSAFVGGFTLEAAEAVCNPQGDLDLLEGLASLVNNSLLRQAEGSGGEPRFGMLETIRAYALEKLAGSGELDEIRERHARYYGGVILTRVGAELYTASALKSLDWIEGEIDNIRATLNWSLATSGDVEIAGGLIRWLLWFFYRRGYLSEGRMWAERTLATPSIQNSAPLHSLALCASGLLAVWQGEQEIGFRRLKESLEIELNLENEQLVPFLLMANGVALINMGRDNEARPLFEESQALFKEQGQPYFFVINSVHLSNVELGLGHTDRAQALLEEALVEAEKVGENWLLTFALNNLGEVARTQGQYDQAQSYYEKCEVLLRDTSDQGDMARFAHSLGYIALHKDDLTRAENQFRDSLRMFRQLGNRRGMAECMAGLAGLKARQRQPQWGATMLSAADSVLKSTGGAWWPADRVEVERSREMLQSTLDENEFTAAWKAGETMGLQQAIEYASNEA